MKILVTGGAGFIGSHIVDRYIELGHEVVIIDNLSTGQKKFIHPKAVFYEVDIRDRKEIATIFSREKPLVLNHHAAQMDVRKSVADPIFDAEVNIIGFLNLLESGRHHGLTRVIFASSGGTVYGDAEKVPTLETSPTRAISPYGISKLTGEYYLNFYNKTYGMVTTSLRYGNVYGPRQNPHGEAGVVAIFTKSMLSGKTPTIYGDGLQSRDFVYVGDVVDANAKALIGPSLTVNIGTGQPSTVNQIFTEIAQLTGFSKQPVFGPPRAGEQRQSLLDIHKAYQKMAWKPQVSLHDGLKKTVAFFKNEN